MYDQSENGPNRLGYQVVVAATCGLEGAKGALAYMPAVDEALELSVHKVLLPPLCVCVAAVGVSVCFAGAARGGGRAG